MRKNEETQVINTFKKRFKINLIYVNEENKSDGFIQPFLVQEFLIKY